MSGAFATFPAALVVRALLALALPSGAFAQGAEELQSPQVDETPFASPEEAFDFLLGSPTFPKDLSRRDTAALAKVQENPETLRTLLIDALASREVGTDEYRRAFGVYTYVQSLGTKVDVARALAGRMGPDQADPFAALLAKEGGVQDLPLIERMIRAAPDGQGVALATTLAERRDLPSAMQRLEELAAERPGIWADAVDLQLRRPVGTLRRAFELRRDQGGEPVLPTPPGQQP